MQYKQAAWKSSRDMQQEHASCELALFSVALGAFAFFSHIFLCAPVLSFFFALANAKARKKSGHPPLMTLSR
jgi:hypothetical protein